MKETLPHLPEELFQVSEWILRDRMQQLSPETAAALREWTSRSPANEQFVAGLLSGRNLQSEMKAYLEAVNETELAKQRVLAACSIPYEQTLLPLNRRRRWLWAAAAAAIILAGIAGYKIISEQVTGSKSTTIPATAANDVPPGTYGARLTLADGTGIDLGSATAGKLASQGNTNVLMQEGRLRYESSGLPDKGAYYNMLSTGNGQEYAITLADKSRVWLNAGSSIRFPAAFIGDVRKVTISGEAFFEIYADPSRPFVVHVTDEQGKQTGRIAVTGTAFNIMAYGDEAAARLTLLSGKVTLEAAGKTTRQLTPGEQALWNGADMQVIPQVNSEQAIAWKNGLFYLHSTSVQEFMRQVARWYNVEVVYAPGVDDTQRISGKVPRNISLAHLIEALQLTDVHCHIAPGAAPPGKAARLIIESAR